MTVTSAACKASAARGPGRWRTAPGPRACVRACARAALATRSSARARPPKAVTADTVSRAAVRSYTDWNRDVICDARHSSAVLT